MKKIFLLTVLSGLFLCGFSSTKKLILIMEKDRDQVKLMWNFNQLPKDITGFFLQKRSQGQEWVNVSNGNLTFGMDKKNIKKADISSSMKKKLVKKYSKLISKDKRLTSKNIHEYIENNPDERNFLLWALCMDYETSLISGLGFIDKFEEGNRQWEYRVVPIVDREVRKDLSSNPVKVQKSDNLSRNIDLKTAFVKYNDKINIHIEVDEQTFQEKNIKGFISYQVKENGSKVPVNKYIAIPKKNHRGYSAVSSVKNVNPDESHTFVIQPITIFDTQCDPVLLNYRPN